MTSVTCGVKHCVYNKKYVCHANGIMVSPKGGKNNQITCCSSFLEDTYYSNLGSCSMLECSNEYVQCKVGDCIYYSRGHCTKGKIDVGEDYPALSYTETYCKSFEER